MLGNKGLLIDGKWCEPDTGETLPTLDPADGQPIAQISRAGESDVERAAAAAAAVLDKGWPPPASERSAILREMVAATEQHAQELAELETREQGRPLSQSHLVVRSAIQSFAYFAEICRDRKEINSRGDDHLRFTALNPIGVVAHIIPWNFPLSMAANRLAMTVAAGCSTLVKPSSTVSLSVLRLAELISPLLPPGALNILTGDSECGKAMIRDRRVRKISFTGSTEVGIQVMKAAADTMKRVTLELGGKTPFIVLDDADIEAAASAACHSAFVNQGQSCAATSRILVHSSVADPFTERFLRLTEDLKLGPGMDATTDMGPLVSEDHRTSVRQAVRNALDAGSVLLTHQNQEPESSGEGFFYLPTVLSVADSSTALMQEEIFGPVVGLSIVSDDQEAIERANDSKFGLCASVWTDDLSRGQRIISQLEVGVAWLNSAHIVAPDSPWGGVKLSGVGRILGERGLENYLEPKQVHISLGNAKGN